MRRFWGAPNKSDSGPPPLQPPLSLGAGWVQGRLGAGEGQTQRGAWSTRAPPRAPSQTPPQPRPAQVFAGAAALPFCAIASSVLFGDPYVANLVISHIGIVVSMLLYYTEPELLTRRV